MKYRFAAHVLGTVVLGLLLVVGGMPNQAAGEKELKIGVVDFQKILNASDAGKRSRQILLASKGQKEDELKSLGDELKQAAVNLKNNILLTDSAKSAKEKELRRRERRWRAEFKAAERDLQRRQVKASESIFGEVQTVIKLISQEENFDFVLELSTARGILFSRTKMINITDKVIKRYDGLSK